MEEINKEYLDTCSLKEKAEIKNRLESNLRLQKMMLKTYENKLKTEDKER